MADRFGGLNWAMASDPAVMQASGYVPTKEGVKYEPSKGSEQLAENLAVISSIPNLVVNACMTGIIPAIASEAAAVGGGVGGSYLGQKLDEKLGTTYWAPIGGIAGALLLGSAPYAASRYINGLKTMWNSGKVIRPEYTNWGGEFINDVPYTQKFRTTIGPEDSFLHPNISRSQRELWAAQQAHLTALSTGDKKLIGEAADALNRQNSKYLTESGLAKMTDLELVEKFNTLRSIASHNRQTGGDYLTYTRKAMKLVPEMNKRGITKAYYPTHDDLTYTLVTDSDRARHLANKFGSQAMKDAAANDISAYDANMAQAKKYRKLADETAGGYTRPMEIGRRTYSAEVDLPDLPVDIKHPERRVEVSKQGNNYSIHVTDTTGGNVGEALAEISGNYIKPVNITKLDGNSKHLSYDVYDALAKLSKHLNLDGVLSGTHLITPQATRKVHNTYSKFGKLVNFDFLGFDDISGPGQPRVIITDELLSPNRIIIKKSGGTIKPNFIQRLEDPNRKSIPNWMSFKRNPLFNDRGEFTKNYADDLINPQYPSISTHKMGYEYAPDDTGRAIVFPEVQEVNGKLVDFTRPPYHSWAGYDSALDRGDYLMMKDLEEARKWVESYKDRYKNLK